MEKLKQRVASSSSRVIASLQQAATGTFQQQAGGRAGQEANKRPHYLGTQQQQQQQQHQQQQKQQKQQTGHKQAANEAPPAPAPPSPVVGVSAARLMAADATAHLTEEEREILLQVFKKEEQFQRDTIKQMSATRGLNQSNSGPSNQANSKEKDDCTRQNFHRNSMRQKTVDPSQSGLCSPLHSSAASGCGSSTTTSGTSSPPFTSARSATPRSASRQHQRAASSCSTNTNASSGQAATPLGQCRICRKFIFANETCHLCSACDQFVCEDCGSYSATDQHWMCSSCRRRATKPAIPADALKELGLNQNSSAVRRMTLRLNQAELKRALGKRSGESSASSSSSSGCSSQSQSTATNLAMANGRLTTRTPGAKLPQESQPQRMPERQPEPELGASKTKSSRLVAEQAKQGTGNRRNQAQVGSSVTRTIELSASGLHVTPGGSSGNNNNNNNNNDNQRQPSVQITSTGPVAAMSQRPLPTSASLLAGQMKQACDRRGQQLRQDSRDQKQRRGSACGDLPLLERLSAHKTLSQPIGGVDLEQPGDNGNEPGDPARGQPNPARAPLGRMGSQKQQQQHYQQILVRRASVSTADPRATTGPGSCPVGPVGSSMQWRQSRSILAQNPNADPVQALAIASYGHEPQEPMIAHTHQFLQKPQAMISESHHTSACQLGSSLFPHPEQLHLRRLSDQSNLVRRSSIISETIENGVSFTRNRSHSNIDTIESLTYLYPTHYQQPPTAAATAATVETAEPMAPQRYSNQSLADPSYRSQAHSNPRLNFRGMSTDDSLYAGPYEQQQNTLNVVNYANQQRRPSDQWVIQQHVAAQQEALGYVSKEHQQQPSKNTHMSSIITPYAKKRRQTSEEMHSNSSSDIDEDIRDAQVGSEFDTGQPSEYFVPSRSAQNNAYPGQFQFHQQQYRQDNQHYANQAPISIPSVSVSEFNSSQQRLNQINQQPQIPLRGYDQIMTTPMEINLAIEQAIQQQQRRLSNEFLPGGLSQAYLEPRRSIGGRLLPKIPGEQSRSLLDLPYNQGGNDAGGNTNGSRNEKQVSTLDLPSLSPTSRRASAPEGQNIKIVVDDMDGYMLRGMGAGGGDAASAGKQNRTKHMAMGELYERLVLYRNDSLDPSTGMAHGFGLQVMGGKVDEDGKLQALVSWVMPGGPSDKVGLKPGDKIIEWDGKCLVNMSYEQVADVIESSANIAELLVKPAQRLETQPKANLVRSHRRMSQQTERDLKFMQPTTGTNEPLDAMSRYMGHRSSISQDPSELAQLVNQQYYRSPGPLSLNDNQYSRAGTGRRLPQIPGLNLTGDSSCPSSKSVLETTGGHMGLLLGAPSYSQQHSLSTGELYPGSQNYAQTMGTSSVGVLNPVQHTMNHEWQANGRNGVGDHLGHSSVTNNRQSNLSPSDEICGLIGLQVNVDERVGQLEVSVLSAINIDKNPSLDYHVRVRILPESKRFKPCTTQPSCDMNWKETFIFQNFPIQQIQRMALEIGIWVYDEAPRLSAHKAQPLCEALIPIHSARERNTDFWPLRPPPTSTQSRRKSLNDLMEGHRLNELQSIGSEVGRPTNSNLHLQAQVNPALGGSTLRIQGQQGKMGGAYSNELIARERSLSNKNLPETSRLRVLPRRASDEVAGSGAHRFIGSTRTSPASGRRSISVINVGADGHSAPANGRPNPGRAGGSSNSVVVVGEVPAQSKLALLRKDSAPHQPEQSRRPSNDGLVAEGKFSSPTRNAPSRASGGSITAEPASSRRRFSLAGIQSMSGYRSQKNSQSGSTDQDSPRRLMGSPKWPVLSGGGGSFSQQQSPLVQASSGSTEASKQQNSVLQQQQQHRGSITSSGSRRGSIEQGYQNQRKGSFAIQTLRKLKRTMSLTKGEGDAAGDPDSRRSSSTSADSHHDLGEDVGLSRRLWAHKGYVGKLKLSFILTKGQLEIDVISAQGLQFDPEFCLGIYVKMYLKGKNRTNKRKTRIVQPCETPIFKQVIKYDGSLVDNKALDISVWQKQSGLKGKVPIGFTEVQLGELNLEQLQTNWYNLRPMEIACNSSLEE